MCVILFLNYLFRWHSSLKLLNARKTLYLLSDSHVTSKSKGSFKKSSLALSSSFHKVDYLTKSLLFPAMHLLSVSFASSPTLIIFSETFSLCPSFLMNLSYHFSFSGFLLQWIPPSNSISPSFSFVFLKNSTHFTSSKSHFYSDSLPFPQLPTCFHYGQRSRPSLLLFVKLTRLAA